MPFTLSTVVDLGKALAHPARLRILAMLRGGPLCVCQITAVLELAASTVSAHLLDLRRGGLVNEDKRGKWVYYALAAEPRTLEVLEPTLALFEDDERIRGDAKRVAEVRRAALDSFCRVGFRPEARRRGPRQAKRAPRTGGARGSSD
jgi:DNA-binding transcriptional ArsR family regulator